jgi:glycerol-3-phosphate acyltransferase PlsY
VNGFVLVAAAIASYFFGTIPSAIVVARSKGVDITTFGSGNPGASNVGRALGFKYFIVVFVIDVAKGAIPTLLLLNHRPAAYVCGAAAILGHIFPITRKFKGGKGVATGAGVLLPLFPIAMIICLTTWLAIMKLSKKAALASVIAVPLAIVLVSTLGQHQTWEVFAFVGIAALIEIRHVSNIKRMLSGSENTLDVKK